LLRLRRLAGGGERSTVPLDIGVAQFDPLRPVAIDVLLESARRTLRAPARVTRVASSALSPQPQ
jgi:hypothetical protein